VRTYAEVANFIVFNTPTTSHRLREPVNITLNTQNIIALLDRNYAIDIWNLRVMADRQKLSLMFEAIAYSRKALA
jgi:predicted amino acid dehydrogenase